MKLIWHIIWKDIRGERWALLFWAALFLAQIALGLVIFHRDDLDAGSADANRLANMFLVGMQVFMGFVLVGRLVQADDISSTRMFWLTRPISPVRMLRAKAWGVLLLFGVLPVLLRLPWWLYCGFTAGDLAWAALDTLGWQLLLIAPAFLIASLTDDLGRALMWGLLLLLLLFGGVLVLFSWRALPDISVDGIMRRTRGGLLFTRLWLSGLVLVAGSILVATHQFRTRRFARSVTLAVAMLGLVLMPARFWPWDCAAFFSQINEPETPSEASAAAFPGLQLTMLPARLAGKNTTDAWSKARTWIQQDMEMQGVPEGWAVGNARLDQSWTWPGDPVAIGENFYFSIWSDAAFRKALAMPAWQGDAETVRWLEGLYADRMAQGLPVWPSFQLWRPRPWEDRITLTGRKPVLDSLIDRIRTQAPAGRTRVELEIARPQLQFELPLKSGTSWSGRSHAYRVGPWGERQEHRADVQLMTARPGVRRDGLWFADAMDPDTRRRDFRPEFTTINRRDNTFGSVNKSGDRSRSGQVVIGGVVLEWKTMNIYSARVIRNGKWVVSDPDWIDHTSLVVVTPVHTVRVTREFKTDKYELLPGENEKAGAGGEKKDAAGGI